MIDGFLIKKLVSVFIHLIPGALLIILGSLITRRWWPRVSHLVAVSLCCVLIFGSMPPVSNAVVASLEDQYPVLREAPDDTALILVLGLGHMYEPDRPANSVLMAAALSRLAEGVRLWKTRPESYLALSGARFRSSVSHARAMRAMALELGVPDERIILFENTRDTEDEIQAAIARLKDLQKQSAAGERLIVTSSATHLPRASLMLRDSPVPYSMAPTDFLTIDAPWFRPGAGFLNNLDRAIHEYIGMLWFKLRSAVVR